MKDAPAKKRSRWLCQAMCGLDLDCREPFSGAKYKMKTSLIIALIFATQLAGVAVQRKQTPEISATIAVRQSNNTELTWSTDFPNALVRAKAEGKTVLLFFHGSDWCPPCAEMQRQVFASAELVQSARRALVLVNVDFPQKTTQGEEFRQSNLALKDWFNLSREPGESFPTIVLLNDAGETVFQETGYAGGGAAEVLPKLQRHPGTGATPPASGVRSVRACDNLNQLDFPNLYNLPGGFRAWAKAGKPVEK